MPGDRTVLTYVRYVAPYFNVQRSKGGCLRRIQIGWALSIALLAKTRRNSGEFRCLLMEGAWSGQRPKHTAG